jgi:hypothetical protein
MAKKKRKKGETDWEKKRRIYSYSKGKIYTHTIREKIVQERAQAPVFLSREGRKKKGGGYIFTRCCSTAGVYIYRGT